MYKNKKLLAIVVARKGSKRIKNKNLIKFCNKPLIEWTFSAAKKSKYIDNIFISTDDKKIIKIAHKNNIDVPFVRPSSLSTDKSFVNDVIIHSLKWFDQQYESKFDYIILLQPTSPLRDEKDIDKAIEIIVKNKSDTLISVAENNFPLQWIINLKKNQNYYKFDKNINSQRKQDITNTYFLNGAIFISKIKFFKTNKSFYSTKTHIFKMPYDKSIDIDTHDDLLLAEFIKNKKN